MTTPFQQAGADKVKATKYAPIWTNRFQTGIWTQRNPLRDAATQYLMEKFYSGSRFESIIDGQNVELTTRLTLARRPGTSTYNNGIVYPRINRFYGFNIFNTTSEIIKVMADSAGIVYDVTGPSTSTTVFTKSAGAGSTYFQSVGNTLYMGNGVDQKKWVQSPLVWANNLTFNSGDYLVDSNNNIQVAMGTRSVGISNVAHDGTSGITTVTLSGSVATQFFVGMTVVPTGVKTNTWLNGVTKTVTAVNYNQIQFASTHATVVAASDTGTIACGGQFNIHQITQTAANIVTVYLQGIGLNNFDFNYGGTCPYSVGDVIQLANIPGVSGWNTQFTVTGVTADQNFTIAYTGGIDITEFAGTATKVISTSTPSWATTIGGITPDGNQQWLCKGSAVQNWGIIAPTSAPTVSNAPLPSPFPAWAANTVYSPSLSIIGVSGGVSYIQTLTTGGTTGSSEPTWSATLGATTTDGSAIWTNNGTAAWVATTAYSVGSVVAVSWTYYITIQTIDREDNDLPEGFRAPKQFITETIPVTASAFFQCTGAGISGATEPAWADGVGTVVADNQVTWTNIGAQATWTSRVGASTAVSTVQTIVDSAGNKQTISVPGKSGATAPGWASVSGKTTVDNLAVWTCAGPYSGANTGAWFYAYAFKNSVTGAVSTASPLSASITLGLDSLVTVQGAGSSDSQVDVIQIYRTLQGGSLLLLLDEIAAPTTVNGIAAWTYLDTTSDANLNEFVQAQTASSNNAPPTGLIALTYHLSRVWGAVGNTVYYSGGPDTLNGNGSETFAPLNSFVFPSKVTRLLPNPLGLLVFTISDIYLISGLATSSSPLFSLPFLKGIGLKSFDALDVNGSVIYLFTADGQLLSLDPNSGVSEIGFPIGDKLAAFDPSSTFVSWHVSGSSDKALYVSDFLTGWYRMNPTSAPETGLTWSPFAFLGKVVVTQTGQGSFTSARGCSAVQSIETSPGVRTLLVGSPGASSNNVGVQSGGAIAKRDLTVADDLGLPFSAFATFGSIVLAHPGQMAELGFITLDAIATGSRPTLQVMLDEISSGPITNTSWQRISNVMYITVPNTSVVSGIAVGQVVTVSGSEYTFSDKGTHHDSADGSFVITSVTPTQFTYANAGNDVGPVTTFVDGPDSNGNAGTSSFGAFESLTNYVSDPPQLAASQSLFASRYYFNQTQQPAWCRHLQVKFTWPAESFANELLSFTMYGAVLQEK